LAASKLIILFVEMLRFSTKKRKSKNFFWKENKEYFGISRKTPFLA
jgi:hypothetical protein